MIKVFIGSTNKDLFDCRKEVIDSIKVIDSLGDIDIIPIYQENFVYPDFNENVLHYCLKYVEESTHYLGIFAHRWGWEPSDIPAEYQQYTGMSITKAEFKHALKEGKIPAVFIPKIGSRFYFELKDGVNQPITSAQAQIKFIEDVRNEGFVNEFDELSDLRRKTNEVIILWVKRYHNGMQSLTTPPIADTVSPSKQNSLDNPNEVDTLTVGRDSQMDEFLLGQRKWKDRYGYGGTAFLAYGVGGQEELIKLIMRHLSDRGERELMELHEKNKRLCIAKPIRNLG